MSALTRYRNNGTPLYSWEAPDHAVAKACTAVAHVPSSKEVADTAEWAADVVRATLRS
jgi:hypothetical protein